MGVGVNVGTGVEVFNGKGTGVFVGPTTGINGVDEANGPWVGEDSVGNSVAPGPPGVGVNVDSGFN